MKGLINKQDSIQRYINEEKKFLQRTNNNFRVHRNNPFELPFEDEIYKSYETSKHSKSIEEASDNEKQKTPLKSKQNQVYTISNFDYKKFVESKNKTQKKEKVQQHEQSMTKDEIYEFLTLKGEQFVEENNSKNKQQQTENFQSFIQN